MRDSYDSLVQLDPDAPEISIDISLSGLFPDKDFRVMMPKDHWHLPEGQHTKNVEITLASESKILVRAFDKHANPVITCSGKTSVEVDLSEDNLEGARFNIQCALTAFHGLPLSHLSTHHPLSINLG